VRVLVQQAQMERAHDQRVWGRWEPQWSANDDFVYSQTQAGAITSQGKHQCDCWGPIEEIRQSEVSTTLIFVVSFEPGELELDNCGSMAVRSLPSLVDEVRGGGSVVGGR